MTAPDASSPLATVGANLRQNALSSRITSVLSASYSDLEIRDTLAILDQRQFKNTSESRRRLRLDVQEEVIRRNGEILNDFKGVADELRRVEASLTRLTATCNSMRAQINSANQTTAPVLEEAGILLTQKRDVETKQHVLGAFQKHFLLSEEDIERLTSTSEPVDEDFFMTLQKLKQIHADSRVLLESSNDRLGLSILDSSGKSLNAAFQKLYRWVQREFKTLDLENPRLSASMRRALRVLAERPALFNNSLDNFASAREETLSNSFHSALTGRGDEVVGKPIEFQAHDPLRYISDMLAWVHSATVSEREALEALFIGEGQELAAGIKEGRENDPWSRQDDGTTADDVFDGRKALNDLVSRDIAGVARQLRQRTEQVVQSQEDATIAFRIANLLSFYKGTFIKLLGEAADVLGVLTALESGAQRQFRETTADAAAHMFPLPAPWTSNLPPPFLTDALSTLSTLLKTHDSSMAAGTSTADLLTTALDPFLNGARSLWEPRSQPHRAILALNCLLATRAVLAAYPTCAPNLATIDDTLRSQAASLSTHVSQSLLQNSGLASLSNALDKLEEQDMPLRSLPLLADPTSLASIATQLDAWLPSALLDAQESLEGLQSARLARQVVEEAAGEFVSAFERVEEAVENCDEEMGGEGKLREVFPRTGEEIRVLLS
ncbi:oligomeric complex COG6 [Microthyrium microscopicum]|uniref:Conserved oligomeric Golgi complex subunit 6 n=1 Tax=Microthyrium microscopicum TaxID=703497 RepID=A0A6A6TY60_9PEZI|nr:oligomeric complex COG6 [Microthyrium microscopicum]